MKKVKRRKSSLSVLIVPDDNAEPITFRLSFKKVRLLIIIGIVLTIHVILGGLTYWRYAVVTKDNKHLRNNNEELQASTKRIFQLNSELLALEESHNRILTALGIGEETASGSPSNIQTISGFLGTGNIMASGGGEAYSASGGELQRTLHSLIATGEDIHYFARTMPTLLPVEGYITTTFSATQDGEGRVHTGIDIAAETGKTIRATADGIVVFAGWDEFLGNTIIIYHENGFFTLYGHNKALQVSNREFVLKGQAIALLGSSGASSGPHLHYEIWKSGVPVNPLKYILALAE